MASGVRSAYIAVRFDDGWVVMSVSLAMLMTFFGGLMATTTPAVNPVPHDTKPPIVKGVPLSAANANGWYNAPVKIKWTVKDPKPSSGKPNQPSAVIVSTEGYGQAVTSKWSCDPAGNCATGTIAVNVDRTAPVVTIYGPQGGATYASGEVPITSCGSEDNLSGLQTYAKVTTVDNNDGTFTATCDGAVDPAGNVAAPVSATYTVA
jgi:hypothetical protein